MQELMQMYKRNIKSLKIFVIVIILMLMLVLLFGMEFAGRKDDEQNEKLNSMDYFTHFTIKTVDGGQISEEVLKNAKVTVFNGWAPWCGPCTGEMPDLQKLSEDYASKGLQVVGIVADYYQTQDKTSYLGEVQSVIDYTGVRYPICLSDEEFNTGAFPTMGNSFPGTWAVDSEGHLLEFVSGAREEAAWRTLFDKWLEEASK